jgi:ATPase family associated with various cellular activities (AAA)
MEVYRVDLSMVASGHIAEAEKNLSRLFNRACNRNWILFVYQAEALFGQRTAVRGAHGRFANQEMAYLLRRLEEPESSASRSVWLTSRPSWRSALDKSAPRGRGLTLPRP